MINPEYRYVVRTVQIAGKEGKAIPATFIALVDSNDIPHSVTMLQNYLSEGQTVLNPFTSSARPAAYFFAKMLNYILIEHYTEFQADSILEITKEMMQRYFTDYAEGNDADGTIRTKATVARNVNVCAHTMAQLSKKFRNMCVSPDLLLKQKRVRSYRGDFEDILVPAFDIRGGTISLPPLRDISTEAFRLLLSLAFQYAPDIAFGICMEVFAGLRCSEALNTWQDSSIYGPCITESTDGCGRILPVVNLTCERVLRSDRVKIGQIKKERYQMVYPDFADAFRTAYAFHKTFLAGKTFEKSYAPMFVNSKGLAMTYRDFLKRFNILVTNHFVPELKKSSNVVLNEYGKIVEARGLSTHIGRHIFTLQLVLRGLTPEQLMYWRGDSSIESSMNYWVNKGELNRMVRETGANFLEGIIEFGGKNHE